ncbi:BZ3500_MvSof-1268-A1-R1_Chr1-2g01411 [Microbotryum saponariae]|uniref:BZ3500_MvSof-1268-A1-R1_Chr1-2g01411 protein n=1 Tax=Microbotryum saponariae TaxID=289078 RepID=A0A2X0KDK4_9BASI|nr:BZ3500_MvSof-1268-A1-R1_Chr1-2g01411 [Microbotryum saponariae]SCZ97356.1 BZ3501_MvSof-1269-A2-R1_Chr1-2g01010 [Microbotryum saponariae]
MAAINTFERHQSFFDCANKVAERYARPDQKIVYSPVMDSLKSQKAALVELSGRLVVTGLTQALAEPGPL